MNYTIRNSEENGEHPEIGTLESAKNRHTVRLHGQTAAQTYPSLAAAMYQVRKQWPHAYIEKTA